MSFPEIRFLNPDFVLNIPTDNNIVFRLLLFSFALRGSAQFQDKKKL